jgi:hypothetical protein
MAATLRRSLALASAAALLSTALAAQQPAANRKLNDAEKKEIQTVIKIVDDVVAGKPASNDLALAWVREDLLKAQNNKEYVPFTVSIDTSKISGEKVAVYWRVMAKSGEAPAAQPAGKKDEKNAKSAYPYEDFGITTISAGNGKMSRSFTVPAGEYDVYVVVKEPTPDKKNTAAPKVSSIKQAVTVPDLWTEELNTSSVIVAERIDPLPAPLTPVQQIERPYALGAMEIVPAVETKFTKKTELSTFLLIYNAKTDSTNKPNVTVEYNFYSKQAGAEKFFNKTNPQSLNAQTLPPNFDVAAGHQLQSGQAVPLASFPEGDYRLEIKITDNVASKSVTRNVNFTVAGS